MYLDFHRVTEGKAQRQYPSFILILILCPRRQFLERRLAMAMILLRSKETIRYPTRLSGSTYRVKLDHHQSHLTTYKALLITQ